MVRFEWQLLAYHVLRERGGAGFLIAVMGLVGCAYFGLYALRGLRSRDLPAENTRVALAAFTASVLVVGFGVFLLAALTTPLYAAQVSLAFAVLGAGILAAFFVAFAVGAGTSEVLGYVVALAVLVGAVIAAFWIGPD